MTRRPTITLGICLAAGVAAGIGLARPGGTIAAPTAPAAQVETADNEQPAPAANDGASGYGNGNGNNSAAQTTVATDQPAAAVTIAGFDFGAPLNAGPGATVTVTNNDGASHTLTADDGQFDTGVISGAGQAAFAAPTAPGTYTFFCSIHPAMQGSLTVG